MGEGGDLERFLVQRPSQGGEGSSRDRMQAREDQLRQDGLSEAEIEAILIEEFDL
jgi:hypothetical protein